LRADICLALLVIDVSFFASPIPACARLFGGLLGGECRVRGIGLMGRHQAWRAGQGPEFGLAENEGK